MNWWTDTVGVGSFLGRRLAALFLCYDVSSLLVNWSNVMASSFVNLLRALQMKLVRQEASVVETKAQIAELEKLSK